MSPTHVKIVSLSTIFALSATLASAQVPASTAVLNGQRFVNQGLVGVGRIPAATRDKYNETLGSFSALTIDTSTWRRNGDGSYSGTLFMQPDRGYNNPNTTNWRARLFKLAVTFTPAASGAQQNQVGLTVSDTLLLTEADGTPMTALDPTNSGTGTRAGFPPLPQAYNGRLSIDAEGLVRLPDGSFFISDEYGPYLYKFSADGKLLSAIRPPAAWIPQRNSADSFSADSPGVGQPNASPSNPTTGRQNNQGMEGLTLSPDGRTLFGLLQSATRQDGGTGGSSATRFNTRLLAYDITGATPRLKAEYVVQLPTFRNATGATVVAAQSEFLAINNTQFLVLARDSGNGHTLATPTSLYRKILVYDVSQATNIAGTKFDDPATPLAPNGVLDASVTPAVRTEFIDLNDATQLGKFGLHNGPADDANNLSEKWEALALVPALDPAAPNDYFLFVGNDNDFITQNGLQDGTAYVAAGENDSMVLVYRLTLPGRLLNVSSRAQTGTGSAAQVVGFVVDGPRPKTLLIRGVGAALAAFGVTGAATDPTLSLFTSTGSSIGSNDNWSDNANVADIRSATSRTGAFTLADGSKDAALLVTLDPGSYSAQVSAGAAGSGVALLEIYEVP